MKSTFEAALEVLTELNLDNAVDVAMQISICQKQSANTQKDLVQYYLDIVNEKFNEVQIKKEQIESNTRKRELVQCRQWIMWAIREFDQISLKQIGMLFGGRDHSTVIHACKTVEGQSDVDKKWNQFFNYLIQTNECKKQNKATLQSIKTERLNRALAIRKESREFTSVKFDPYSERYKKYMGLTETA